MFPFQRIPFGINELVFHGLTIGLLLFTGFLMAVLSANILPGFYSHPPNGAPTKPLLQQLIGGLAGRRSDVKSK
jgi:hypothetical protein